jgi:hypothetical protein
VNRKSLAVTIAGLIVSGLSFLGAYAAPPQPSRTEWSRLRTYAAWTCRESIVAPRCRIDMKPVLNRFTEIRQQFSLSDGQNRTLDTGLTICLQGQPPPEGVDPAVCSGANRALSELDHLFPR